MVALYPPGSPHLKLDHIREAEQYNMTRGVPGRIQSIVNIHNPSIEVHTVEPGVNTGTGIILAAGGAHNTLNVGTESGDFVHDFYNYGVNTVIQWNRRSSSAKRCARQTINFCWKIQIATIHRWRIVPNAIGSRRPMHNRIGELIDVG